jgi:hypothetical protein
VATRAPQPDPASQSASGELEPGQSVDRGQIGVDQRADVAQDQVGGPGLHLAAKALAQTTDVSGSGRAVDDHDELVRIGSRLHRSASRPLLSFQAGLPSMSVSVKTDPAGRTHRAPSATIFVVVLGPQR